MFTNKSYELFVTLLCQPDVISNINMIIFGSSSEMRHGTFIGLGWTLAEVVARDRLAVVAT